MNDETVLDSPETILDGTEDPLASTEETVEILEVPVMEDHPLLTTSFADYTVTEGLLLLIFVILFLGFFVNLFGGDLMLDIVYEFFGLAGLDLIPPDNLAELIPYLLQFIVAVVLVLGVFKVIGALASIFVNWRWFN